MAFRRQDIPKTTRKTDDGGPRRIYPRFLRDRAILPKVEIAIGYLDGMVGRRRGDLSPDILLDLLGDPKLARCLLACLAENYRYRTPEFAEVIGEERALALAAWDILSPADLRAHVYLAANAERGGFVATEERQAFLAEVGEVLGVEAGQMDELLHLDAERNAILLRAGPRPRAEDVVARYNVLLCLSVLRHASAVTLELPGLHGWTVEAVCARHEVECRRVGPDAVRLQGRRSAVGTWSGFGARVARCVVQLLALAPQAPSGEAKVHFGEQTLRFAIDAKVAAVLRPKLRAVAGPNGIMGAAGLADEIAAHRRGAGDMGGWVVRRWPEPIVVDGALALPELTFTREQVAVAAVSVPAGAGRAGALAAIERVNSARPVIALGAGEDESPVPALAADRPEELLSLLERVSAGALASPSALDAVAAALTAGDWVPAARLDELLGQPADPVRAVGPLTVDGAAVFVPGFGLCRTALLEDLHDRLLLGPTDVATLRAGVAALVGEDAGVDALTLHLLAGASVVSASRRPDAGDRRAA